MTMREVLKRLTEIAGHDHVSVHVALTGEGRVSWSLFVHSGEGDRARIVADVCHASDVEVGLARIHELLAGPQPVSPALLDEVL